MTVFPKERCAILLFLLTTWTPPSRGFNLMPLRTRAPASSAVAVRTTAVSTTTTATTTATAANDSNDDDDKSLSLPYRIHLFSLQWSSLDDARGFSKPIRDLWRWKDAVLGDGRDFFVPRPKTLRALQEHLMTAINNDENSDEDIVMQECVIVSNCARFEIYVVTSSGSLSPQQQGERLCRALSRRLLAQCHAHQQRSRPWTHLLPLDWPAHIVAAPQSSSSSSSSQQHHDDDDDDVRWRWTHTTGPEAVCHHACLVASGMATRPNRPTRPVVFRPFSSRDAHVLLQVKRTLSSTTTHSSSSTASAPRRLATLWRTALTAGKAARNERRVPALRALRQVTHGVTGDSDSPTAAAVTARVQQAALRDAVEPAVQKYVESLRADAAAAEISRLRHEALALATDEGQAKWIKRRLHAPTVALRRGESVNVTAWVEDLRCELV